MLDIGNCFTYAYSLGTFADFSQDFTSGDEPSTNLINLDAADLNIAAGRPLFLVVIVTTVASLTDCEIVLETDTAVGFATAKKQVAMWNLLEAQMTEGAVIIKQARPVQKYQQFMRLKVFPNGGAQTVSLCAFLTDTPETAMAHIDQISVST